MPDSAQERTESATPKRRREAREKGQVAKSKEIGNAIILAGTLLVFYVAGRFMTSNLLKLMRNLLHQSAYFKVTVPNIVNMILQIEIGLLPILLPILLSLATLGVLANYFQVGFLIAGKTIIPDLSRINPVSGFKNIFSLRKLVESIKAITQISIIGFLAYITLKGEFKNFPKLLRLTPGLLLNYLSDVSFTLILRATIGIAIIALLDYLYQSYEHEKSLKMTKEEVKEEHKQTEGDPKVKGRIRSIQLTIARKRMMAAVPQADVIITNPTHIAIAIQYKRTKMEAPTVIAKGAGYLAEKIKDIAKDANIPIVENKPLARMLYKLVEIGDYIPPQLYQAVAEILAFVYNFRSNNNR